MFRFTQKPLNALIAVLTLAIPLDARGADNCQVVGVYEPNSTAVMAGPGPGEEHCLAVFVDSPGVLMLDVTTPLGRKIIDIIRRMRLPFREVPVRIRYTEYSMAKGQSHFAAVRIVFHYLIGRLFP